MSLSNMSDKQIFDYHEESQSDRLARKSKDQPFFPIAITGCAIAVAIGAYKFRHRGNMSTSMFLMQLRVTAQGIAVGALTLGLGYSIYNEHFVKKDD